MRKMVLKVKTIANTAIIMEHLSTNEKEKVHILLENNYFKVENTGVTISDDDIIEVFEPFYRVEKSRNKQSQDYISTCFNIGWCSIVGGTLYLLMEILKLPKRLLNKVIILFQ